MVFQSYALWPHMTVGKNIAFGLEERGVGRQEVKRRVAEALAMVHLDGFAERSIDEMSGGQQQRVALARALVVRPKCLLLDEPLSNLDAQLRLEMRREIRRIVKENKLTAVYVTHDQEEALAMADRMAVLTAGRVEQTGTPEEIYRNPVSARVAAFIGETNFIDGTILECNGATARVETPAGPMAGRLTDPAWHPAPGEPARLSIRPEAWTMEGAGENRLDARVTVCGGHRFGVIDRDAENDCLLSLPDNRLRRPHHLHDAFNGVESLLKVALVVIPRRGAYALQINLDGRIGIDGYQIAALDHGAGIVGVEVQGKAFQRFALFVVGCGT